MKNKKETAILQKALIDIKLILSGRPEVRENVDTELYQLFTDEDFTKITNIYENALKECDLISYEAIQNYDIDMMNTTPLLDNN